MYSLVSVILSLFEVGNCEMYPKYVHGIILTSAIFINHIYIINNKSDGGGGGGCIRRSWIFDFFRVPDLLLSSQILDF